MSVPNVPSPYRRILCDKIRSPHSRRPSGGRYRWHISINTMRRGRGLFEILPFVFPANYRHQKVSEEFRSPENVNFHHYTVLSFHNRSAAGYRVQPKHNECEPRHEPPKAGWHDNESQYDGPRRKRDVSPMPSSPPSSHSAAAFLRVCAHYHTIICG